MSEDRPKEMRRLSASRLNSINDCLHKFFINEYLRIPEKTWPKTYAGSAVHSILECLYRDYYRKEPRKSRGYYDVVKLAKTIYAVPALVRMLKFWQYKTKISDKLLADTDSMVMLIINETDFLDSHAIKRFDPEYEFDMVLKNGAKVKGFIDRLCENPEGFVIHDYKSQGRKFLSDDLRDSFQSLTYQLHIWKTFGKLAEVRYYLLRFPPTKKEPFRHVQITMPATPSQLAGFELYLEKAYEEINSLTYEKSCTGYHEDEGFCSRVCSYRRPMQYISVKKKDTNKLVKNYMLESESIKIGADEYMETLFFGGCKKWNK